MDETAEVRTQYRRVAQTGWAAKQSRQYDGESCHYCGRQLDDCLGCGDARCLNCEPYLSDDCRWAI